jgi:hypothetical protein
MSNLYRGHSINNLVGSTYGRFCIKFPQSRMKGEWHRASSWFPLRYYLTFIYIESNELLLSVNKICLWQPCLLMDQNEMSNLYRGHSINASYQVSCHLAKWLQRKTLFRNWPIRNKNCIWWPCLLTDQNEMSNPYRGPSPPQTILVSDWSISKNLLLWHRFTKWTETW